MKAEAKQVVFKIKISIHSEVHKPIGEGENE